MKKIITFLTILTIYIHAAGDTKSCKLMGNLSRAGLGMEQEYTKAYKSCVDDNIAAMDKK